MLDAAKLAAGRTFLATMGIDERSAMGAAIEMVATALIERGPTPRFLATMEKEGWEREAAANMWRFVLESAKDG